MSEHSSVFPTPNYVCGVCLRGVRATVSVRRLERCFVKLNFTVRFLIFQSTLYWEAGGGLGEFSKLLNQKTWHLKLCGAGIHSVISSKGYPVPYQHPFPSLSGQLFATLNIITQQKIKTFPLTPNTLQFCPRT